MTPCWRAPDRWCRSCAPARRTPKSWAGRARRVDGGYVLQGHWPFSSGVDSSAWNMLAGIVASDDEADGIEYRIFLLPKRDYKIIDNWDAAGLRGTGSNDVEVDEAFVA